MEHEAKQINTPSRSQVLVVGAGPVGLMTAALLRRFGILVDIVEKRPQSETQSKALAINPISLMLVDLHLGKGRLAQRANRVDKVSIYTEQRRLLNVDLNRIDGPYKHVSIQPQDQTVNELIDIAESEGISIEWGTKVEKLKENATGVSVTFSQGGKESSRNYQYVIGCDGKYSVVRQAIGSEFIEEDYGMYLVLGDYEIDIDLDNKRAHYFVQEETFFVLIPLNDQQWRVVVKYDGNMPPAPTSQLIEAPLTRFFGKKITIGKRSWLSQAQLTFRYTETLQSERLFIAGDAAHLYSPLGGTGMNTGFLDATNIAWKLAFYLNGFSTDQSLLTSYQQERVPSIIASGKATDYLTRQISLAPEMRELRKNFMPLMVNRPALRNVLPKQAAGLGIAYDPRCSAQLFESGEYQVGIVDVRLLPLIEHYCRTAKAPSLKLWVMQFIDGEGAKPIDTPLLGTKDITVRWSSELSSMDHVEVQEKHGVVIAKELWRALSKNGTLQVIRPDGYISFAADISGHGAMVSQLSSFLKSTMTEHIA